MRVYWPLLIASVAGASTAYAETAAEKVARLRAAVDDLAQRVDTERRSTQEALVALRAERAELKRQLRLEAVRAATIDQVHAEHRARADGLEGESLERMEPVRQAVAVAKAYVLRTLPFLRQERLRTLSRIKSDLAATHPDPSSALSRLWRFVEEEEALAGEVGLFQQPVTIDGTRQLVDVARVGMAFLYFRTADGRHGRARRTAEDWVFELVADEIAEQSISALFAALDANRTFGPQLLLLPESAQ